MTVTVAKICQIITSVHRADNLLVKEVSNYKQIIKDSYQRQCLSVKNWRSSCNVRGSLHVLCMKYLYSKTLPDNV